MFYLLSNDELYLRNKVIQLGVIAQEEYLEYYLHLNSVMTR